MLLWKEDCSNELNIEGQVMAKVKLDCWLDC